MACARTMLFTMDASADDYDDIPIICTCSCTANNIRATSQPKPQFYGKSHGGWYRLEDLFLHYANQKQTLARLQKAWDMINNYEIPEGFQDYADFGGDEQEVREAILKVLERQAEDWSKENVAWNSDALQKCCSGWSPLAPCDETPVEKKCPEHSERKKQKKHLKVHFKEGLGLEEVLYFHTEPDFKLNNFTTFRSDGYQSDSDSDSDDDY